MKIIYVTIVPVPFAVEIFQHAARALNAELVLVFHDSIRKEREHWNTSYEGHYLQDDKAADLVSFLAEQKADMVFFSSIRNKITNTGIKWCVKNNTDYFLGPHENITPNHVKNPASYKRPDIVKAAAMTAKFHLYKKASEKAKGIVVMGHKAITNIGKFYKGPMISLPYSFDITTLLKQTKPSLEVVTFLFSGKLTWYRHPLLCIECFADLADANPNKKMKLIVSGQGELEQDCRDLIKSRGIEDKVEWIQGFSSWYDILRIYEQAHIALILQDFSNWGLITQEAMSAGMTFIGAGEVGSLDELVINNYNGFLTNLSKKNVLFYMQKYIDQPELITIQGKRNRDIAPHISVDYLGKELASFIKSTRS